MTQATQEGSPKCHGKKCHGKKNHRWPCKSLWATLVICACYGLAIDEGSAAPWDPVAVIAGQGYSGNATGAVQLLRSLAAHTDQDIERWVRELDAEEFPVREQALRQLLRLPAIPRERWQARVLDEAPERRWRLQRVLARHGAESTQLYRAALHLLAQEPASLHGEDWLAAQVLLERVDLREETLALLKQHVPAADAPLFRAAARSPRVTSRLAAAVVLARSVERADATLFDQLLGDADDQVALVAAQGLLHRGDQRAVSRFIELLDSEQVSVRRDAATWLIGATAQEFDYSPWATKEQRQLSQARWREWLAGPGALAAFQPPPRIAVQARGNLAGHTLIATGGLGKVCELDERGNVVWQQALQAWSAEKLPGGHVLIASHWENRVVEFDERGNVVWQITGISAIRAKPLPGGRVLIADFGGQRVVEADPQGTIVWEHATPDQCFDAERLAGGNTIFVCPNLLREVAPNGAKVRDWIIEGRANSLQVLPSGRLLVANYGQGRVIELDDSGRVTWEHKIARPSDAFRLPGGRTLITTAEQIVEVDLQGRLIRTISAAVNGGARQ